jgi:hypothetical protein
MGDEIERMWQEVVVAYLTYSVGIYIETMKNFLSVVCGTSEIEPGASGIHTRSVTAKGNMFSFNSIYFLFLFSDVCK